MTQDNPFTLDPRLQQDCIVLQQLPFSTLLLMNNASLPWFILVPRTTHTELHHLAQSEQQQLQAEINAVSRWAEQQFQPEKLNVAAIGNIVRQMHIHIVARYQTDPCWPGVVWGQLKANPYDDAQLAQLKQQLTTLAL